ncbi:hypothetical protein EIJ81_00250 (plasmid) [Aliivibrio salmonicida]|uniref:hypothetical protein n=1 Tax=Aliivibrio salmonicida TaxID=40269 RepID=UPI000F6E9C78|nr:hypothetical protein [Aliivibrio salmonicida]AZL83333.1 hypothetical protein EIJ81_00250 [Aliivibrio salmonicida]
MNRGTHVELKFKSGTIKTVAMTKFTILHRTAKVAIIINHETMKESEANHLPIIIIPVPKLKMIGTVIPDAKINKTDLEFLNKTLGFKVGDSVAMTLIEGEVEPIELIGVLKTIRVSGYDINTEDGLYSIPFNYNVEKSLLKANNEGM